MRTATKIPTVKEYGALRAQGQKAAHDLHQIKFLADKAELRAQEARLAAAKAETEAYPFKVWALMRWPEPHKLGQERMQAIFAEMDGK